MASMAVDSGPSDPTVPSSRLDTTRQLEAGLASMQGHRPDMQDAHAVVVPLPLAATSASGALGSQSGLAAGSGQPHGTGSERTGLFGVFDGHGGTYAAKYGSQNMLAALQARPAWAQAWAMKGKGELKEHARLLASALAHAFLDIDASIRVQVEQRGKEDAGSTAVVCLLTDELILVGNAGDSRATLLRMPAVQSSAFTLQALPLTHDHKPASPSEKERIEAAGSEVYIKRRGGIPRIDGNLAVSRGLGDLDFKYRPDLPAACQAVSALPEITVLHRHDDMDAFLLLACDGVWDVMSEDDVARLVSAWILAGSGGGKGATPGEASAIQPGLLARAAEAVGTETAAGAPATVDMAGWAEALVSEGFQRGSTDSLSALFVALPAGLKAIGRGPVTDSGAGDARHVVDSSVKPAVQAAAQPQVLPVAADGTAEASPAHLDKRVKADAAPSGQPTQIGAL